MFYCILPQLKFGSLFVVILMLFMDENAFSQESIFKGPVAYLEVAGAGFNTYNINVEHLIFSKSRWYVNGRAGFGYSSYDGDKITRFRSASILLVIEILIRIGANPQTYSSSH